MATWNHKKTKLGYFLFVFVAVCHMFNHVHVDGRSISSSDETIKLAKHKGTIKTIQREDGDVIDCVDIYKQPAFDHPLLKNHTIQMKPSSYIGGIEAENFEPMFIQDWYENEQCPEGTIPIVRAQIPKPPRTLAFIPPRKDLDKDEIKADPPKNHEYAEVSVFDGNYFGAAAWLNVWNPATFGREFSLAQIWVVSGEEFSEYNTIEAGWITKSGQKQTRLFIYWTVSLLDPSCLMSSDGYQKTGCYNLDCPGFVQTSNKVGLGSVLQPISTYEGNQFEMHIYIHKDKQSGNWWLTIQQIDVGYWPGSIFSTLSDRADRLSWGGEIVNLQSQGHHTYTQMGSGHFPRERYTQASYIRNLRYTNESGFMKDVENVLPYVTRPECYDLQMGGMQNFGTHFFFGGPGYSDKCK
ncbi:uncharacterized protein LOC111274163 [Durio zibethinus]|uniref:Uncharacterized protein LOC111274163 n=1 Tax=Durio zibethinus TaxID=66656 RepID=A0A6P5WF96_DURZI|nr:uncharacterized protein LOC111274163 [Durio zibethinus]